METLSLGSFAETWGVISHSVSSRETPASLWALRGEGVDQESSGKQLRESGRQTHSATDS